MYKGVNMKNQPKTWNELLDAGYVIELTETQIGEFKAKLNPMMNKPFSYANDDHLKSGILAEEKMRKKK